MIGDIHQPAKNWLADHILNFITLIECGEDPSCMITMKSGIKIEVRLITAPDYYYRDSITLQSATDDEHEYLDIPEFLRRQKD